MSGVDWSQVMAIAANRPTEVRRHEHVYTSAVGAPLHRTVRIDYSDLSKRIWQQRFEGGEWVNGLGPDFRTVLYRLPAVIEKSNTGGLVLLVEGEKVVDAIEALGITATTNAMGSGKWFDDFSVSLVGAYVVLCPDADLEGRRHMVTAGRSLLASGAAVFGPLELDVFDESGRDLYDYLVDCAATLRAVEPELDREAVRRRLRRLLLRMVRHCLPATTESLSGYLERAVWRVEPKGREMRYCARCKRDRPHTLAAGLAYCACGARPT